MAAISDVFILDVSDKLEHRKTKHCVCVSVSKGVSLLINSRNSGIYNELEIKSTEYEFLDGENRYVGCSLLVEFKESEIIKKVGNINYNDMRMIVEKLKSVKKKEVLIRLKDIIAELEKWLADYNRNKLTPASKCHWRSQRRS